MKVILVMFLAFLGTCWSDVQDKTRLSNSKGPEVVEAVVNMIRESCLFPDDKLFLRRLAYVETRDGTDPSTYRPDFDGGIWQVDRSKFERTQSSNTSKSLYGAIKSAFSVDWASVHWSELRKPLYSGLATTLYLTSLKEEVPRLKTEQSRFYAKYFNSDIDAEKKFTAGANTFDIVCRRTNLDLAFLVDASSSLSPEDFDRAKHFAHNVVDNFKIGSDNVRVAFVTFSSGFTSEFGFDNYTKIDSLQKAIDGVLKSEGRTDTDLALDYASEVLFTKRMGSREGSSKVILLITDGKSTKSYKTIPAALRARNKGIVIFAIGVGSDVDVQELEDVANKPICTHVIQMKEYSDLNALVDEIQQVSCIAPTVLKRGKHVHSCSHSDDYQVTSAGTETMVTITDTDGMVNIYGSLSNPNPSEAGHDFYSNAIPEAPSVILINNNHKPVYFNISNNVKSFNCVGNYTINIGTVERVNPNAKVTCVDQDMSRTCSVVEVIAHLYTLISPPYSYANPCIKGLAGFKPHPSDMTMFLFCDGNQNVFQFGCPLHHIYNIASKDCIPGEAPSTSTSSSTKETTKATTSTRVPTSSKSTTFRVVPTSTKSTTSTAVPTSTKSTTSTAVPTSTRSTSTAVPTSTKSTTSTAVPTSTRSTSTAVPISTRSTSTAVPTSTRSTSTAVPTSTEASSSVRPSTEPSTSQTTSTEAPTTSSTEASTSTVSSTTMSRTSERTVARTDEPSTKLLTTAKLVTTRSPSTTKDVVSKTTASQLKLSTDSVFYPSIKVPNYGPNGPCSEMNIKQNGGSLIFPYAKDKTKYIECTNWPNFGYVKSCQEGKIWDQLALTCVFESVVIDPSEKKFDNLPNPCTNFLSPDSVFFPHPLDTHMYIHCDQYGNAFEKTCPAQRIWNQSVLQCIPQGLMLS